MRERAAEEKNTSVENIARDMKQREAQKRTYERIGNSLKSSNFSKVTWICIPKHLLHSSTEDIWQYIQQATDDELKTIP